MAVACTLRGERSPTERDSEIGDRGVDSLRNRHRPSDGQRTGVSIIITEAVGPVEAERRARSHEHGLVPAHRGGALGTRDVDVQGARVDVRAARITVVGAEGQRADAGFTEGARAGNPEAGGLRKEYAKVGGGIVYQSAISQPADTFLFEDEKAGIDREAADIIDAADLHGAGAGLRGIAPRTTIVVADFAGDQQIDAATAVDIGDGEEAVFVEADADVGRNRGQHGATHGHVAAE